MICHIHFKTQPGPVAKNATPRPPAGNWTKWSWISRPMLYSLSYTVLFICRTRICWHTHKPNYTCFLSHTWKAIFNTKRAGWFLENRECWGITVRQGLVQELGSGRWIDTSAITHAQICVHVRITAHMQFCSRKGLYIIYRWQCRWSIRV